VDGVGGVEKFVKKLQNDAMLLKLLQD